MDWVPWLLGGMAGVVVTAALASFIAFGLLRQPVTPTSTPAVSVTPLVTVTPLPTLTPTQAQFAVSIYGRFQLLSWKNGIKFDCVNGTAKSWPLEPLIVSDDAPEYGYGFQIMKISEMLEGKMSIDVSRSLVYSGEKIGGGTLYVGEIQLSVSHARRPGTEVRDAAGNEWTIAGLSVEGDGEPGSVFINGAIFRFPDATPYRAWYVAEDGGVIYTLVGDGEELTWNQHDPVTFAPSAAPEPSAEIDVVITPPQPPDPEVVVPPATTIPPATELIDASGATWTLVKNVAFRNGESKSTAWVQSLRILDGKVQALHQDGRWGDYSESLGWFN